MGRKGMPAAESDPPLDVSVILVNWNTRELLRQCLGTIPEAADGLTREVIVVDNDSRDGSSEMVAREFPEIRLLKNHRNIGFAAANNQALRRTTLSRYILFLNTDAILHPGTLRRMTDFFDRNPTAGAVGPALRFPDGRPQPSGGFFPSARTGLHYFLFLSRLAPRLFPGLFVDPDQTTGARPIEMDWAAGTCLMIRNSVWQDAGGMDESFFMYAEDAEWCRRIRKSGWRVFLLPDVEIVHLHGASSLRVSDRWIRALIQLVRSSRGSGEALLFRIFAVLGLGARALGYLGLSALTNRPEYYKKAVQMAVYTRGALR